MGHVRAHGTRRARGESDAVLEEPAVVATRTEQAARPTAHPCRTIQPHGGPRAAAHKGGWRRMARGCKKHPGGAAGGIPTAVRRTVEHRQAKQSGKLGSDPRNKGAKQHNANDTDMLREL